MSCYLIRRATSDDNAALCALCQIPMKGNIMLTFERSPDFFAGSKIQSEEIETYACVRKASNKISGVFSVGKRRVFYKNEVREIRYLSDLRIHPEIQGLRLVYEIGRFITDNNILADNVAQSIVFAENEVMLRLVEKLDRPAKKMLLLKYFPAGNYISYMVKFSRQKEDDRDIQIKKAGLLDIPQMQALVLKEGPRKEFFPYYDFNQLQNDYYAGLSIDHFYLAYKNKELIGIAGIWDQHQIKQTRIYNYSIYYKLLRPFINIFAVLTGGFLLPAKGKVLRYLSIHSILIKNNNFNIFNCLLAAINNDYTNGKFNYFLVGLDEKDDLNKSLYNFSNKRIMKGKHFLVANKETVDEDLLHSLYYLEAARI